MYLIIVGCPYPLPLLHTTPCFLCHIYNIISLPLSAYRTLEFLFLYLHGQDKWTSLMIASQNGHVDVVDVLLQHGAGVHLQNKVKL